MKLETEVLNFRGSQYEARELTIEALMPLMERFAAGEDKTAQMDLLRAGIYEGGEPLGDKVLQMPGQFFLLALNAVTRVNGMTGADDEEAEGDASGND